MIWFNFPQRLQSALKCLCCLASTGGAMQAKEIAGNIGVSRDETAKVLQLLVWGGFVSSRRGSKGGFRLINSPDRITAGEVIEFFLTRHSVEPKGSSPVLRALRETGAPCQEAFSNLALSDIVSGRAASPRKRSIGKRGKK